MNKLIAENFAARVAQANLIKKTYFDAKLSSLNRKITLNETKHFLVENELKKLKTTTTTKKTVTYIHKKVVNVYVVYPTVQLSNTGKCIVWSR